LTKLHPELAKRVTSLISELTNQGLAIEVVQGLRTFEEQNELYKEGRTKPSQVVTNAKGGQSNHNYGLAVDLCPFVNGKPQWNDNEGFIQIGVEAAKHGFEWGGKSKKNSSISLTYSYPFSPSRNASHSTTKAVC